MQNEDDNLNDTAGSRVLVVTHLLMPFLHYTHLQTKYFSSEQKVETF